MQEETEKRDQLIFELITDRYRLEWQRTEALDTKASGIISFVGIILTLQVGLGTFFLKSIPKENAFYNPLIVFFVLSILFLIISIVLSLDAYSIRKYKFVPESAILIDEYGKKDRNRIDILRIVTKEIADAVKDNETTNNGKNRFIICSFIFFAVGISMILVFFGILLFFA